MPRIFRKPSDAAPPTAADDVEGALAELARPRAALEAGLALTPYELKAYSQNGEDGVIAELLRRCGTGTRWFVEFGIGTGAEGNCVYLADVLGWEGLFIEADDEAFTRLETKYAANSHVRTVHAAVTPENVEELFASAGVPSEPDVLSIDVDGPDYWIWQSLDAFSPRIAVIEYNAALRPERRLVKPRDSAAEPWDGTDYFGASLGALGALGETKGLRLVHTDRTGVNAFFVREGLTPDLPAPDAVPAHEPNFFMSGIQLPHDPQRRPWWDLDLERLEPAEAAYRDPGSATPT
jgi:hypothetical protein